MALDATPGGVSANTYSTEAEADTYHADRLHATDWTGASSATQEASLKWATRLLDERVDWDGAIAASAQALRWPRSGLVDRDGRVVASDSLPTFLKSATAEFAMRLIASDLSADRDGLGLGRVQVDRLRVNYDKDDRPGVLPEVVRDMVRFYGTPMDDKASAMPVVRGDVSVTFRS
jgi:hypothetical protein